LTDIDGLIVVDTPDTLLIIQKGNSQEIKTVVKELKGRDSDLHHVHLNCTSPPGNIHYFTI